ncbi:MAG: hypothetical protein FWD64_08055 [Acidobacteriaceae bacterium]|nr:hypothetical protein [Acidobacteriaceae bacterium]
MLRAQATGRFDLAGPKLQVRVTRSGKTLPIASVPNLQPGDKVWLHPVLPPTQSVHYLLVAAFLRGTTNPPPNDWFFKIETWNKKVREDGATITVPAEAQQAVLFLAPETGGDFSTLRSAVRGRPGIFVRASQDLSEAGFEQARIEKYLSSIQDAPPGDSKALQQHSDLLARTLNLKPDGDCFTRPVDQQYNCLTQSGSQTLLDDGHGKSLVTTLTTGSSSDLISAASNTALAGGGMYSSYVGTVVDLVRLLGGLHTAQYLYIPAIAFPEQDELNLRLNMAPSFHNPKSVIVIGLPAIQKSVPPPLRPADPDHVTCLLKPRVVLPVEGAPLVFSTGFAHDLVLHINGGAPRPDIPLVADAYHGGLVLTPQSARKTLADADSQKDSAQDSNPQSTRKTLADASSAKPDPASTKPDPASTAPVDGPVTGTIKGYWGFDSYTGPTMSLQEIPGKDWTLASNDLLIAGRENHLSLTSTGTACIKSISLETASGFKQDTNWKRSDKPNTVDITVALRSNDPEALHLDVEQYGNEKTVAVATKTYSEPAKLTSLSLHEGDNFVVLTGSRLSQVEHLGIGDFIFTPAAAPADTADDQQNLTLLHEAGVLALKEGEKLFAHVSLKDGRMLILPVAVEPARPSVKLLSKNIGNSSDTANPAASSIRLANADDLPVDQQLTFSLRSAAPFPRTGQIEIANADASLHTMLTVANGTLVLQNAHTLLCTLDPLKTFGTSAFGPLRLRAIAPDGTTGDWLPLATLVRLPLLKSIQCPEDSSLLCTLTGTNLYLVESVDVDPAFPNPIQVPEGYVSTTIALPRPGKAGGYFLKLRDDPAASNAITLQVPIPPPPAAAQGSTAPAKAPDATTPDAKPPDAGSTAVKAPDTASPDTKKSTE